MSQHKDALDLLKEAGKLACKPMSADSPPVNRDLYQRLIGKLIYLDHTRPDWLCCEFTTSIYA